MINRMNNGGDDNWMPVRLKFRNILVSIFKFIPLVGAVKGVNLGYV